MAGKYDSTPTIDSLTPEDVYEAAAAIAANDLGIDLDGKPSEFVGQRGALSWAFAVSNLNQADLAEAHGCNVSDLVDMAADAAGI